MSNSSKIIISVVIVACCRSISCGAPTLDGSLLGDSYGSPLAVQTVNTGFGNNDGFVKGTELDAAYAKVESGTLYLLLTGNLEDNFNKLVLFFDSKAGGQNTLDTDTANGGSNPVVDPSPFGSDPGMFAKMATPPFPTVLETAPGEHFTALPILRQGFTGSVNRFDADYAIVGGGVFASQYLGRHWVERSGTIRVLASSRRRVRRPCALTVAQAWVTDRNRSRRVAGAKSRQGIAGNRIFQFLRCV